MFSPQVTLPSGGYLVINPTEALVSIDVNSGRSTKEHNIEDTALQTNLEAADEVARQLRLRDLAGLIVIDFIDMIENRSNRAVERRLKEALKNDRARIQVGRISHFGLMEMSRQRIRFGVVESSTHKCPTCNGTGLVRSVESVALMVMRNVEDHVLKRPGQSINVRVPVDVALYILNTKRGTLATLEMKHGLSITIVADDHVGPQHYVIEKGEARIAAGDLPPPAHIRVDTQAIDDVEEADAAVEDEEDEESGGESREARSDEGGERGGRRRRRRRGGRDRDERGDRPPRPQQQPAQAAEGETAEAADGDESDDDSEASGVQANGDAQNGENGERRRRRRGRRGGRRNRRENGESVSSDAEAAPLSEDGTERVAAAILAQDAIAEDVGVEPAITVVAPEAEPAVEEKPRRARRSRKSADSDGEAQDAVTTEAETARPRSRGRRAKAAPPTEEQAVEAAEAIAVAQPTPAAATDAPATGEPAPAAVEPAAAEAETRRRPRKELPAEGIVVSSTSPAAEDEKPKKAGWWQRGFFGG